MLTLALEMGVDPGVIENEWDEYYVNRLMMLMEARAVAKTLC